MVFISPIDNPLMSDMLYTRNNILITMTPPYFRPHHRNRHRQLKSQIKASDSLISDDIKGL